ncbi:hypothetical protein HGA34_02575 [Candidatus Falkowbacteria bacterium]|nr:hypothetical protein [Candidatus Falkowbacteria bacterium]
MINLEYLTIDDSLRPLQEGVFPGQAARTARAASATIFCVALLLGSMCRINVADAATNVSMSVEENPYNKVAAQLKEKEKNISERERLVSKYEKELQRSNMVLALFVLLLFLLIMLNYYLDYHRRRLDEEKKPDNVRYLKL